MRKIVDGALLALAGALIAFHPSAAQTPAQTAGQIAHGTPVAPTAAQPSASSTPAATDHLSIGDRTIPANATVNGPIAVARGNVDVYGTVIGDVYTLDGSIRVHRGARVTGDAWSTLGSVLIDGGVVQGQKRSINPAAAAPVAASASRPLGVLGSIKLVCAWFALLAMIGVGVMVFAEGNLDGVVVALERGVARSFWVGLAGQVLLLPLLVVIVVALAVTVIGVLLVPFAIVTYVIAVAGLVTLGFLAVARLTGGAVTARDATPTVRGVHVRALVGGLVVYFALWLVAALFASSPVADAVVRLLAIAATWVAATVGLGATLLSRAGTQRAGSSARVADDLAWQTPTPVSGVAAASRRPISAAK